MATSRDGLPIRRDARVFDLEQPRTHDMPVHPAHRPGGPGALPLPLDAPDVGPPGDEAQALELEEEGVAEQGFGPDAGPGPGVPPARSPTGPGHYLSSSDWK